MKFLVIIVSVVVLSGCNTAPRCPVRVLSVGGCDRDGRCGVKYSDGSFGDEFFPVEGMPITKICK
jgi:hypothetical protein